MTLNKHTTILSMAFRNHVVWHYANRRTIALAVNQMAVG